MATSAVEITVRVEVIHADGTKISKEEIRRRVRRLLDEYENGEAQPNDFFLTDPVLPIQNIKVIHS